MKEQNDNEMQGPVNPLKFYTPGELAKLYGVSPKTLKRKLMPLEPELGERLGRFFSIKQVRLIFDHLGNP